MKKNNVLIVHGTFGYPEENWFMWLKSELEKKHCYVILPRFPTPEGQSLSAWLRILDGELWRHEKNLIMVGHSLGPALILRKLELIEGPISAAFLVSGFIGKLGAKEFDELNSSFFTGPFDWGKIRNNCPNFFMYHACDDPYVPIQKSCELALNLGTTITLIPKAGHFNVAAGYTRFEKLLNDILHYIGN
jgi:predicted alpha/beta hydrolase family esterase